MNDAIGWIDQSAYTIQNENRNINAAENGVGVLLH